MTAPRRRVPQLTVALILGVAAISFAAIFFRLASPTHPLVAAGVRLAIAACLLMPWLVGSMRRGHLTGRVFFAALAGGLFYGLHFGAWVWSLELTTIAASTSLVTATPVMLAVLGLVTGRDRPGNRLLLALGLSVTGVLIVATSSAHGGVGSPLGAGLALLGAAAMAGYLLLVRRLGPTLEVWPFMALAALVASTVLLWTAALADDVALRLPSTAALGYLALAALLPQLVGHGALTWALRHATPTTVGTATLAEPAGATLLAWLLLGEVPAPAHVVGGAVVICGVALALRRGGPRGEA